MSDAIGDREHAEEQQRQDLDRIDGQVGDGRSLDAAIRYVRDPERGDNCNHRHEDRTRSSGVHAVGEKDADDVADHNADSGGHRARVDPIIQIEPQPSTNFAIRANR